MCLVGDMHVASHQTHEDAHGEPPTSHACRPPTHTCMSIVPTGSASTVLRGVASSTALSTEYRSSTFDSRCAAITASCALCSCWIAGERSSWLLCCSRGAGAAANIRARPLWGYAARRSNPAYLGYRRFRVSVVPTHATCNWAAHPAFPPEARLERVLG